jgi:hypothetical protein
MLGIIDTNMLLDDSEFQALVDFCRDYRPSVPDSSGSSSSNSSSQGVTSDNVDSTVDSTADPFSQCFRRVVFVVPLAVQRELDAMKKGAGDHAHNLSHDQHQQHCCQPQTMPPPPPPPPSQQQQQRDLHARGYRARRAFKFLRKELEANQQRRKQWQWLQRERSSGHGGERGGDGNSSEGVTYLDVDMDLDVDMHAVITGQRADRTIDLPSLRMGSGTLTADDEVLACALHFEQRLQQQLQLGGSRHRGASALRNNSNKVVVATADNGLAVKTMAHGVEVGTVSSMLGAWRREEADRRRLIRGTQAASAVQQAGWSSAVS